MLHLPRSFQICQAVVENIRSLEQKSADNTAKCRFTGIEDAGKQKKKYLGKHHGLLTASMDSPENQKEVRAQSIEGYCFCEFYLQEPYQLPMMDCPGKSAVLLAGFCSIPMEFLQGFQFRGKDITEHSKMGFILWYGASCPCFSAPLGVESRKR